MIDKYDEFRRRMQMLLLKKEREYGPPRYLLFRTTEETSNRIDDLVQAIVDILHRLELIPKDTTNEAEKSIIIDDQNAIKCYYYILLNTNFSSQQLLIEDPVIGHLVGACPALSPYVFIQIIWSLRCEEILCESLQHMPLDLCVEVLEIAVKCVTELESTRDVNLLFDLTDTIYLTCLRLRSGAVSRTNAMECANQLVAIFHTILDQISEFACSADLPSRTRYERHGHLLKRILRKIQTCMHWKTLPSPTDSEKATRMRKLHELTYGDLNGRRRHHHALTADEVQSVVAMLDQELVNLLLREIKRIDCNEYMEWADIDDAENRAILLQRAVAIECHYFVEFMRNDAEFLARNEHLLQCLRQLMGSNSDEFGLSINEICHGVDHGRPDGMRELLRRHEDWDQSALDFVGERTGLFEGRDYNVLLEHLHHVFGGPRTEDEKHRAYTSVLRTLLRQDLPRMFAVVTTYVAHHPDDDNRLRRLYSREAFEKFVARNEFIRDAHSLRALLIFALLDARSVVTELVRIAIGCYECIIFAPRDILLLRPLFRSYRLENGERADLFTSAMRTVCLENTKWSAKHFGKFVQVIVDSQLTHPDDLMNDVFIPYLLESSYEWSNLLFVATYVHNVIKERRCSSRTDYTLLYKALLKRLSSIRKCNPSCARGPANNIMLLLRRILHNLSAVIPDEDKRRVMNEIGNSLEPLDRELNGHAMDVIRNYERRCVPVYRRLSAEPALAVYAGSFRLDREAFVRHMMLHASTTEFEMLALQLTTVFWFALGWTDEMDALGNVTRIATDAARLVLARDRLFPADTFIALLRAIVRYCSRLADIGRIDPGTIRRVLATAMSSLDAAVRGTRHRGTYESLLARVDKFDTNERACFDEIEKWIDVCLVEHDNPERESNDSEDVEESRELAAPESDEEIRDMINAYTFVCRCIAIPVVSKHVSANWMTDLVLGRLRERRENNISCDTK